MGMEGTPIEPSQRRRPLITGAADPILAQLNIRRLIMRLFRNLSHNVESRMRQTSDGLVETAIAVSGVHQTHPESAPGGKPVKETGKKRRFSVEAPPDGVEAGAGGAGGDADEEAESVESSEEEDEAGDSEEEEGLPWDIRVELAESVARVLWNVSRSGANATNASLIREGGVATLLTLCHWPGRPHIQVRLQ